MGKIIAIGIFTGGRPPKPVIKKKVVKAEKPAEEIIKNSDNGQ